MDSRKLTFAAALLLTLALGSVHAASWDVAVDQRNANDNGWLVRLMPSPSTDGLLTYDAATRLPRWTTLGTGLGMSGSVLNLNVAPVALSGAYADLSGRPVIPAAQVPADWNATSGPSQVLNKPAIPAAQVQSDWAASSGVAAIANKPTLAPVATSGAYGDLTGRPSIPAPQVQTDWNAVSGLGVLLNKPALASVATSGAYADLTGRPTIPAAQVQSDWSAVSGITSIANKPALAAVATSGAYADLSGRPTIPAAQVQTDWNAVSGLGVLLNKPTTFAPAPHTHAAADIVSGTLADARIPALAISKTTGLQTALDAKFNAPAGTTAQYVRGDGSLATLPTAAVFAYGAPVARTVALGTAYQCTDVSRACVLTITLSAQSSISLSGTSNNEAVITTGATNAVAAGTGTNVATYRNLLGGGLVVGLSITSAQANTYTVTLPAGWYFAVRQTTGTGLTVVSAFDQTAG